MSGQGGSEDVTAPTGSREEPELEETYDRLIEEGHERLDRPLLPLLATGFLGGIDVGVGVLMFLVVKAINKAKKLAEKPAALAGPPDLSAEEKLLIEIRDLLKQKA